VYLQVQTLVLSLVVAQFPTDVMPFHLSKRNFNVACYNSKPYAFYKRMIAIYDKNKTCAFLYIVDIYRFKDDTPIQQ
jgi:hypothetical protein